MSSRAYDEVLAKLREICLALPETTEGVAWKHPVFRVAGKMFCGYEQLSGKWTVGLRMDEGQAEVREHDTDVVASQYMGKHKWVSIDDAAIEDWDGIADLIRDSYRLTAPKKALAKLEGDGAQ